MKIPLHWMQFVLKGSIICGSLLVFGTLLGEYIFIFDLFSHFYVQIFLAGIYLFVCSFFLESKVYSLVSAGVLVFLGYTIFPVLFGTKAVVENVDMYYINANYYIDNTQAVMEDIEKYDPTYVAVVELRPDLKDALIQKYGEENSIIHDDDVFSYGVFGREEILSHIKHRGNMYPFLEFSLAIGDFYLIHPLPPTSLFGAGFQKEYFAEVREVFDTNTKDNKYILGDFNSSHYSKVFQHYFGDLFYDIIYSWKRSHPLSIPIDYVIGNTDNFAVQTNNLKASDHSPFLIYFKRSSEK